MNKITPFLLSVTALLSFVQFGRTQQTLETQDMFQVKAAVFDELDRSKMFGGLLIDQTIQLADLDLYDSDLFGEERGEYRPVETENFVTIEKFELILASIAGVSIPITGQVVSIQVRSYGVGVDVRCTAR